MVTCAASVTRYSKEGGVLAKVASDSAHAVKYYKDARKILRDGLDAIISNSSTTSDEKSLATMGVNFGVVEELPDPDVAEARHAVMSAIASAMPGSIGKVIAGTAMKVYENVWNYQNSRGYSEWRGARRFLREGFDTILRHFAETTQEEKALAQMGIAVGKDMDDIPAINARLPIMKKIAGLT